MLSSYKNKRILVTGGAGFIGSHLTEKLISLGAHVTVLDNLTHGTLDNLRKVIHQINFLQTDITSLQDCHKATAHKDVVFHLAALTSASESLHAQERYMAVNVHGTENILQSCAENNVPHLVFASSAAVYGNTAKKCSESDTLQPLTPYAESKLRCEQLCKKYAHAHNQSSVCLRYFNVFGPRQQQTGPYASVIPQFIAALKENKPLTIYGDGHQTRDFVPVAQVVEATLLMGLAENMAGEIFNIASGKSISLLEVVESLKLELGLTTIKCHHAPERTGDIRYSIADCAKYQKFASEMDGFPLESKDLSLKFISQTNVGKQAQ